MAMTNSGRANAIYNEISSTPNFSKLSSAEQSTLKSYITSIWGAGDLAYIQANAEADPGMLATTTSTVLAPPGTAGGPCTGLGSITGKGTIN